MTLTLKPFSQYLSKTVALAAVLTCLSATAQWQWLDDAGKKVYSDRAPPPEVLEKNILKRPGGMVKKPGDVKPGDGKPADGKPGDATTGGVQSAQAAASVPKLSTTDKELEQKKKQAADAEAAKRKADEEKLAKSKTDNCARAKQAKATYDSGIRIARTNAAGEREILDDAQRAEDVKRAQSIISSDCK